MFATPEPITSKMKKSSVLDTESEKNNVFVTQNDDDEDVRTLVTDPESPGKLANDDRKTLQTTHPDRKNDIFVCTQLELEEKRREFEIRMEGFAKRRGELQERRQKMKDRVVKFERFIHDNNLKREKAFRNYQAANAEKQKKSEECSLLYVKIMELKKIYAHLTKKIERYCIYKQFLNQIVETLPKDYIWLSDDKARSLLLRYQTLNATNDSLIKRLNDAGHQLKQLKQMEKEMQRIHDKETLEAHNEMVDLTEKLEARVHLNEEKEQLLTKCQSKHTERSLQLNVILLAIDTIVEKCHKATCQQIQGLTVDEKLKRIKEWLFNKAGLVKLVQAEMAQPSQQRHRMNAVKIIEPAACRKR